MAKSFPTVLEYRDALVPGNGDDAEPELRAPITPWTAPETRETRADGDEDAATTTVEDPGFEGFVSTFWTVDSYASAFAPGAFRKSIGDKPHERFVSLWQHWTDETIGRHISLREIKPKDDALGGLFVKVKLSDDGGKGSVAIKQLRDGVPLGLSFGFITRKDRAGTEDDPLDWSVAPSWSKGMKPEDIRIVETVEYWESSLVTFASNPKAAPSKVRSALDALPSLLDATRAGTLTPDQCADIEQFVNALREATGPDLIKEPSIAPKARRRDLLVELTAARLRWRHLLEQTA